MSVCVCVLARAVLATDSAVLSETVSLFLFPSVPSASAAAVFSCALYKAQRFRIGGEAQKGGGKNVGALV